VGQVLTIRAEPENGESPASLGLQAATVSQMVQPWTREVKPPSNTWYWAAAELVISSTATVQARDNRALLIVTSVVEFLAGVWHVREELATQRGGPASATFSSTTPGGTPGCSSAASGTFATLPRQGLNPILDKF
jgi:hypothetical protein